MINLATLNIVHGGNERLEWALKCMEEMKVDLGILMETKITGGIHTRKRLDYEVVTTDAMS